MTDARTHGSAEGLRQWVRRSSDPSTTVDVFGAIQDAGIWLMFQPLGNLYGAFERLDGAVGILINSNHPLSLQRYTAAHEFGHFVMDHQFSADSGEELYADNVALQEAAAQSFAADFLMPVPVVNYATKSLGIDEDLHSAQNVYRLAVALGTSYRATITQLNVLHLIDFPTAQALREVRPLQIKQALLGDERPENSRADVWSIPESSLESGQAISVQLGDELVFDLEEIPSSGYLWAIDAGDNDSKLEPTVDSHVEPSSAGYGAAGRRLLGVSTRDVGSAHLSLGLSRPWTEGTPVNAYGVTVNVEARLGADDGVGLTSAQLNELLVV